MTICLSLSLAKASDKPPTVYPIHYGDGEGLITSPHTLTFNAESHRPAGGGAFGVGGGADVVAGRLQAQVAYNEVKSADADAVTGCAGQRPFQRQALRRRCRSQLARPDDR